MQMLATDTKKVLAHDAATAWLNAAVAASDDKERAPLYRKLSVEFYATGIQFIGCDGTMLFRTWAPYSDIGDLPAPHPEWDEAPEDSVVVSDTDKFALGFMKTLLSACQEHDEVSVELEPVEREDAPALGDEFGEYVLTLHAHGQRLSCPLYDGPYPNWRGLQFGLDSEELVDGMTLATRIFKAVGKLKAVGGVDCSFRGKERAIEIKSTYAAGASLRGLLMPMRKTS